MSTCQSVLQTSARYAVCTRPAVGTRPWLHRPIGKILERIEEACARCSATVTNINGNLKETATPCQQTHARSGDELPQCVQSVIRSGHGGCSERRYDPIAGDTPAVDGRRVLGGETDRPHDLQHLDIIAVTAFAMAYVRWLMHI